MSTPLFNKKAGGCIPRWKCPSEDFREKNADEMLFLQDIESACRDKFPGEQNHSSNNAADICLADALNFVENLKKFDRTQAAAIHAV